MAVVNRAISREDIEGWGLGAVGATIGAVEALRYGIKDGLQPSEAVVTTIGRVLGKELVKPHASLMERLAIGYAACRVADVLTRIQ